MQFSVPDLPDLDRMALIVVDVQQGFDDAGTSSIPVAGAQTAARRCATCCTGEPVTHGRWSAVSSAQSVYVAMTGQPPGNVTLAL